MSVLRSIVLYAVGSPLVADVEESCIRLDVRIAGAISNVDTPHCLLDPSPLRGLDGIDTALLNNPCIVPLFTPARRQQAAREAAAYGFSFAPALVDPTAIVASSAKIGAGSYLNAGVVIGAATRLGGHVIVNRASSIGHHGTIADLVSIGPGVVLAGQVCIGAGSVIGAGAVILPEVEIGEGSVIGAGAVVTRSVPPGSLAVGNPAKVMKMGLPLLPDSDPVPQDHSV